jgi:hypothetical protein
MEMLKVLWTTISAIKFSKFVLPEKPLCSQIDSSGKAREKVIYGSSLMYHGLKS